MGAKVPKLIVLFYEKKKYYKYIFFSDSNALLYFKYSPRFQPWGHNVYHDAYPNAKHDAVSYSYQNIYHESYHNAFPRLKPWAMFIMQ